MNDVAERERCIAVVKVQEGGFVANPKDPGGATKFGITARALADHRGHPVTADDVRALTWPEADAIYGAIYWPAVRGDELPPGVDLIVFDAGVNCGRGRAATFLQLGLGFTGADVDGALGSVTLGRLRGVNDLCGLVERIRLARLAYYQGLSTWAAFGTGWSRRLNTVAHTATAWAAKAPAHPNPPDMGRTATLAAWSQPGDHT